MILFFCSMRQRSCFAEQSELRYCLVYLTLGLRIGSPACQRVLTNWSGFHGPCKLFHVSP